MHERAMQEPCHQVCGGLQVLLDANKAFDLVPRSTLFQFLNDLPISQVLITLLSEWHDQTAYIVNDGITQQRVATGPWGSTRMPSSSSFMDQSYTAFVLQAARSH